jgi:hypothetical protein
MPAENGNTIPILTTGLVEGIEDSASKSPVTSSALEEGAFGDARDEIAAEEGTSSFAYLDLLAAVPSELRRLAAGVSECER